MLSASTLFLHKVDISPSMGSAGMNRPEAADAIATGIHAIVAITVAAILAALEEIGTRIL
jgi:hypothetical protein